MSKRRMTEVSTDLASITLTDHRGRTLLRFHKEKRGWCVSDFVPRRTPAHKARPRDFPSDRLKRLPDGRCRLDVPGPLLPWDDATRAVLDRLAVSGITQLTVDELRFCVDSNR